jgi:hypothetical protein
MVEEVTSEIWNSAFLRLAEALNHGRDHERLAAAVHDDIRIDRYQPGARAVAALAETFTGSSEVARWFARTPAVARFTLAGAPWPETDGTWAVEYAIDADDFHNGGIWVARQAEDGRIEWLSHHPFALRDEP